MDAADVVRQGLDCWNAHDRNGFGLLCSDDIEILGPGGLALRGREGWVQFFDAWQQAFPDGQVEADVFATGDRACEEATFTGTHTGVLRGPGGDIAPTDRPVRLDYVATYTVRDKRVTQVRMFWDQLDVLSQLGLVPEQATV